MSWSATLTNITKNDGNVIATVVYTSDTGEILTQDVPGNDLTPEILAQFVGNRIQVLNVRDLAFQTLSLGPISLPANTPDQQAQLDGLTAEIKSTAPAA